ncbi:hypothetical protein KSS87_009947 [Heliosperma pusillum]|nr:hypothetical protein KSS87_011424 [Heliosperma pusillum]KAH9616271.1 hypothetical protein KSS87_009947 [Heliosperma pusillum]
MKTGKSVVAAEILGKRKVTKSSSSSFLLVAFELCNQNNTNKRRNGLDGPTCCTPVSSWLEEDTIIKGNSSHSHSFGVFSPKLSARKIAFTLWEFHYYYSNSSPSTLITKMEYLGVNNNQRLHRPYHRDDKDDSFDHFRLRNSGFDPPTHATHDHHPESAGSLRRHIAASLMRHHQSAERNKHALQPLSPASYGSSLEMAPYNPAATPDSSIELRGRVGDSSYSFKTSTELLKVLNRIWSLEEQHASNMSLVKGLKSELDHARLKIKELFKEKQANHHEIDQLMKRISVKDHERIDAAVQSVRDELENERRLRKRSESLHRKLARELFEVKVALSTTVKEHEKEKQSSEVLEELCDRFAIGIREYARHVQTAKQKSDVEWTGLIDHDNLVLQMSESWLDQRAQMKDRETQQPSVVDRLRHEIETFLVSDTTLNNRDPNRTRTRRCLLEAIPEAATAPQGSAFSHSHCAEESKAGASNREVQEELALRGRKHAQGLGQDQNSDLQSTPREIDHVTMKTGAETHPTGINMLQKSDIYDSMKEQRKKAYDEEGRGSNSKTVDKLINEILLSEGESLAPPDYLSKETGLEISGIKRNASPIRQWMTSRASPNHRIPDTSSGTQVLKDSSLKARLQEPKSKGQRSRLKILKSSS